MKIILFNDEGRSIASFEHVFRREAGGRPQAFELLDLLEKLLEWAARDAETGGSPALPLAGAT